MGLAETVVLSLPLVDWLAILILAAGMFVGAMSGLGRAFGILLWLLAAIWLASHLSGVVVGYLPNTVGPNDPNARLMAFGGIAGFILSLPVLARMLTGPNGKKKDRLPDRGVQKPSGALVGLLTAVLFLTLALPFVYRLRVMGDDFSRAYAPAKASTVADHMSFLYPDAHRAALRDSVVASAQR
jgi:hypothetical protein